MEDPTPQNDDVAVKRRFIEQYGNDANGISGVSISSGSDGKPVLQVRVRTQKDAGAIPAVFENLTVRVTVVGSTVKLATKILGKKNGRRGRK